MASNVLTSPNLSLSGYGTGNLSVPVITRGKAFVAGTLLANSDVVEFVLAQPGEGTNGLDVLLIVTAGGTITAGLEGSVDGTNWFGVLPRAANGTAPNLSTAATLNSDTAATSANLYDVSGLQQGVIFRFGGRTAGSPVVTILFP